ncbi:hypothetical protein D3C76_1684780 [compost metagenome]
MTRLAASSSRLTPDTESRLALAEVTMAPLAAVSTLAWAALAPTRSTSELYAEVKLMPPPELVPTLALVCNSRIDLALRLSDLPSILNATL